MPELRALYRVNPRTLIMATTGVVAVGVLLSRVGNPVTFWDSIRGANWLYLALAVVLGLLYNADKSSPPVSWAQALDLRGQRHAADCGVVWPDARDESFLAAWRLTGVDSAHAKPSDVKAAATILGRARETFVAFEADSSLRAQSGEPYWTAPSLGRHAPRQSVLEKEVPAGTVFRWEIRP